MNFIRKKLKAVHSKPKHDDDDDYDNYIPAVPPHPSTLTDQSANSLDKLPSIPTSNGEPVNPLPDTVNADELLEQLRLKELERRQEERERLRAKEESKRDREDWKFFLSLTAKVEDIKKSVPTALEKLRDSSAVDEITNKTDNYVPDYYDESDANAPKPAGRWIAFQENHERSQSLEDQQTSDKNSESSVDKPETNQTQRVIDELSRVTAETAATNSEPAVAAKLLDDFGFNEEPEVIPVAYQPVVFDEEDYLDDPFDTSFVDVSRVEPKAAAELILGSALGHHHQHHHQQQHHSQSSAKPPEPDPFDTSYVDSALTGQSVVKPDSIDISPIGTPFEIPTPATLPDYSSRLSRASSRDSIMSNPFLTDLNDYYTPYASGAHTPYSGTVTPKRRNSTNPFEVQSPEDDDESATPATAMTSSGQPYGEQTSPVASAIADMTADFYNAIASKSYNDPQTPPSPSPPSPPCVGSGTQSSRGSQPRSQPFDPFATIRDDDTPKRQSLGDDSTASANIGKVLSPDAGIAVDPFADDDLPWPQLPPESAFLAAGVDHIEHTSDSDIEDDSVDARNARNADTSETNGSFGGRRRSSAFQMELLSGDKDSPAPTFEPLPTTHILQRKSSLAQRETTADDDADYELVSLDQQPYQNNDLLHSEAGHPVGNYFDPFTTVFDGEHIVDDLVEPIGTTDTLIDTTVIDAEHQIVTCEPIGDQPVHKQLSAQDSIADVGQPNRNATGIVNDGFDDTVCLDDGQPIAAVADDYYAIDADISVGKDDDTDEATASETNAIHDGSITTTTTTTTANIRTASDSGVAVSSQVDDITDCGKDPFDTSEFDSAAFDAFATKFDQTGGATADSSASFDPFASPMKSRTVKADADAGDGFDIFDPFARPTTMKTPKNTPARVASGGASRDSFDDDDTDNLKIVIKAKMKDTSETATVSLAPPPLLPPPPKSPKSPALEGLDLMPAADDEDGNSGIDEFEAFFGGGRLSEAVQSVQPIGGEPDWPTAFGESAGVKRADSTESPQTPLFDEDTSQPLEEFPAKYAGDGWELMLRHPNKKKLTATRYWKKVYVRFLADTCVFQLFNKREDNNPFQETPLQASYSLSDIAAQQLDQYGKIFTIKLQYIFYRERVGVRPGQLAKVMHGQITSMGQIAKLGMPLEHAPQVSELLKFGSTNYGDLKQLQQVVEEALFRMVIHRDRALQYKTEEIQCAVQDELYVEQNRMGAIVKQLARVRIFFLAFVNGMPSIEVGINDLTRQGKEVVGRHDIIPVVTEEWIRLEGCDFHVVVQREDFEATRIIKLTPPDACHFELMRFRIRPPRNRELPLQVSAQMNITKARVELKCEVLVPGCISRKHGQIPCEDILIRFHIPECWIYFFRTEKHFRYGALKSAHRRTGKIKGIERLLGAAQNQEPQLIEVTAGQAKYEHAYHAVVWRIPRLPKEGQGAYTQQLLLLRLPLTSFDQIPDTFYEYVHVEFRMPSTTVSHTTLRSISVTNENPPEKYVRYLAKYEYKIEMGVTFDERSPEVDYVAAAATPGGPAQTGATAAVPTDAGVNNNNKENESDDDDNDSD